MRHSHRARFKVCCTNTTLGARKLIKTSCHSHPLTSTRARGLATCLRWVPRGSGTTQMPSQHQQQPRVHQEIDPTSTSGMHPQSVTHSTAIATGRETETGSRRAPIATTVTTTVIAIATATIEGLVLRHIAPTTRAVLRLVQGLETTVVSLTDTMVTDTTTAAHEMTTDTNGRRVVATAAAAASGIVNETVIVAAAAAAVDATREVPRVVL